MRLPSMAVILLVIMYMTPPGRILAVCAGCVRAGPGDPASACGGGLGGCCQDRVGEDAGLLGAGAGGVDCRTIAMLLLLLQFLFLVCEGRHIRPRMLVV